MLHDAAMSRGSKRKWHDIARSVKGRSAKQCRDRWKNHIAPLMFDDADVWAVGVRGKFIPNDGDDARALAVSTSTGDAGKENRSASSDVDDDVLRFTATVPVSSSSSHRNKAQKKKHLKKCSRKIGKWSEGEDARLLLGVKKFGAKDWPKIAILVQGRNSKQCRDRWSNHLDPRVKSEPWTKREDRLIDILQRGYGNHWAKIAKCLGNGRTGNAVKNRYHSTIGSFQERRRRSRGKASDSQIPLTDDETRLLRSVEKRMTVATKENRRRKYARHEDYCGGEQTPHTATATTKKKKTKKNHKKKKKKDDEGRITKRREQEANIGSDMSGEGENEEGAPSGGLDSALSSGSSSFALTPPRPPVAAFLKSVNAADVAFEVALTPLVRDAAANSPAVDSTPANAIARVREFTAMDRHEVSLSAGRSTRLTSMLATPETPMIFSGTIPVGGSSSTPRVLSHYCGPLYRPGSAIRRRIASTPAYCEDATVAVPETKRTLDKQVGGEDEEEEASEDRITTATAAVSTTTTTTTTTRNRTTTTAAINRGDCPTATISPQPPRTPSSSSSSSAFSPTVVTADPRQNIASTIAGVGGRHLDTLSVSGPDAEDVAFLGSVLFSPPRQRARDIFGVNSVDDDDTDDATFAASFLPTVPHSTTATLSPRMGRSQQTFTDVEANDCARRFVEALRESFRDSDDDRLRQVFELIDQAYSGQSSLTKVVSDIERRLEDRPDLIGLFREFVQVQTCRIAA